MPEFFYTARTAEGKLKRDRINMKDEQSLANYLRTQGYILTSAKPAAEAQEGFLKKFLGGLSGVSVVEKIFFTQNLEVMLRTGFSLAAALKTIGDQTENKRMKQVIINLQQDVENGIAFSTALGRHPRIFGELFVNMVAAGEASGKLDEVLKRLTDQMRKDHALIAKVRSALTYPAIVIFAMIVIGIVMMTFVIPKLLEIFADAQVQLPLPTRILIWMTHVLTSYGIFLLFGVLVIAFVLYRFKKTYRGKRFFHLVMLKMPIASKIIKNINIARFTRTLSSLLKTDIPIVQTFQIISKTLGNVYYSAAVMETSEQVKKGISIMKSLETKRELFPPIVTQMISVGEESGSLDTISEEIAKFYEEAVDQTMQNLSTIIEPVLVLFLGAAVAGLALAVILPIYSLSEAI